jgi:hypothetical protein
MNRRQTLGSLVLALAGAASANAFFPPVVAPVNRPVTVVRDPTVEPIQKPPVVPPVDPCVKPQPKPRHCYYVCDCEPGKEQNVQRTPEPATLVSTGIGLAIAGVVSWSRKRRRPTA